MGLEDILSNAREVVRKVVPSTVEITNIEFEGPTIVLYTKNMDVFAENNDLVRQLAQSLRKRVTIRPDIHARFLRILAKVDGAVEARPAQAQSTRTMLGVDASDIKGGRTKRRAKSEGEWSGSWDNAIEHAEEE